MSNFDEEFTSEDPVLTPAKEKKKLTEQDQVNIGSTLHNEENITFLEVTMLEISVFYLIISVMCLTRPFFNYTFPFSVVQ